MDTQFSLHLLNLTNLDHLKNFKILVNQLAGTMHNIHRVMYDVDWSVHLPVQTLNTTHFFTRLLLSYNYTCLILIRIYLAYYLHNYFTDAFNNVLPHQLMNMKIYESSYLVIASTTHY
jgi:hypothetical protein